MCRILGLRLLRAVPHNLVGHFEEHFVNIAACLGRSLKELESVLLGEGLTALGRNDSVGQICFVCDEHLGDSLTGVRLNLLQPVADVVKRGLLRAVVHQNDAHRALVIRLRDRAEALLPGRVPHLQLHALVLHVDRLDLEVNACTKRATSPS